MARNCPRCNVGMKMETRLGVEVDKCPECKGIWFDNNELDKLSGGKALEGAIFTARVLGKELKCPACGNVDMQYMSVEGVTIDHCPTCEGVWLDEGELKKLRLAAPERQYGKDDAPYKVEEGKPKNILDHLKGFFHKEHDE